MSYSRSYRFLQLLLRCLRILKAMYLYEIYSYYNIETAPSGIRFEPIYRQMQDITMAVNSRYIFSSQKSRTVQHYYILYSFLINYRSIRCCNSTIQPQNYSTRKVLYLRPLTTWNDMEKSTFPARFLIGKYCRAIYSSYIY